MVSRSKVFFAAFVLFAAGAATGGVFVRSLLHSHASAVEQERSPFGMPAPMSIQKRMEYVEKLDREVTLTPGQRQTVEQIITESQGRMKKIWQEVEPRVKDEYRRCRRDISGTLTPEQLEKMTRWNRERMERYANKVRRMNSATNSGTNSLPR